MKNYNYFLIFILLSVSVFGSVSIVENDGTLDRAVITTDTFNKNWNITTNTSINNIVLTIDNATNTLFDNNLTAWYQLNDYLPADSSLYGNNGTLNGYTFNDGTRQGGQSGATFDGVDDFVNESSILNITTNKSFTIGTWLNPLINNDSSIFGCRYASLRGIGIEKYFNGIELQIRNDTGSSSLITTISLNQLIYFVGTYDSLTNNMSIYVNGIYNSSMSGQKFTNSSIDCQIGSNRIIGGTANWFNGSIYRVNVWNRALNSSEIASDYAVGKDSVTPVGYGLVAQYILNDSQFSNSTTVKDINHIIQGKIGNAYNFAAGNQTGHFVNYPYVKTINTWENGSYFAWVNPLINSNTNGVITVWDGLGNPRITMYVSGFSSNSNSFRCEMASNNNTGATSELATSSVLLSPNKWYFLGCVFNESNGIQTINAYINGVLNQTSNINETNGTRPASQLYIGTQKYSFPLRTFNGSIDDVRIYNYSLTPQQILFNYNSQVTKYNQSNWNINITSNNTINYYTTPIYLNVTDTEGTQSAYSVVTKATFPSGIIVNPGCGITQIPGVNFWLIQSVLA